MEKKKRAYRREEVVAYGRADENVTRGVKTPVDRREEDSPWLGAREDLLRKAKPIVLRRKGRGSGQLAEDPLACSTWAEVEDV